VIQSVIRRATILAAFVLVCAYAFMALRGPQGLPSLLEKRQTIRSMEEENANLKRDIDNRKKLIHDLEFSKDKQDEAIRRFLNQAKPNETEFILPDHGMVASTPQAQAAPAPQKH
jgi:cell division protein FtsB